jgi:hypothetical protein
VGARVVRMPENAPVVVFLFLTTLAVLAAGVALLLWSLGKRKFRRARRILEGMAVVVAIYAGTLLTYSLTSRDTILEPGQEKYLCEIDCHLAYSVAGVSVSETLGAGSGRRAAGGLFYAITIRTLFDSGTASSHRGDSPLWPNPRRLALEDQSGGIYFPSREGIQALASEGKAGIPLDHPLRPGESYSTTLVFDLPREARGLRLLIAEDLFVTRFLIGHENSFLHGKIWLGVNPSLQSAGPLAAPSRPPGRGEGVLCYTPSPWNNSPRPSIPARIGSARTRSTTAVSPRS